MFRRTGFAATVLLAGVPFSTTAAAAATPLGGDYLNVGSAQVQVRPGSKSANVTRAEDLAALEITKVSYS